MKAKLGLPVETRYADGSYRRALRWKSHGQIMHRTPIRVRVIEYTLPGVRRVDAR